MPKATITGYRVEVLAVETEKYETFFGGNPPCTLDMATSMATHLKRSKAGGRIVEAATGVVIEEWPRTYTPEPPGAMRARVQAIRDAAKITS